MVVALSGPLLGEKLNRQRLIALAVGMAGVMIILRPGSGVFSWAAALPLVSAFFFALYSVLTRLTARSEPNFPSFFWPAVIGAVVMTFIGVPKWQEVAAHDWPWMFAYAAVSVLSNWLLLKTYELAEASAVQPFAYMQFVFITIIGIFVFGESLSVVVVLGVALVIAAGIYALISERKPRNG
jgi:drug/metabolite transporter (DMT)-like permease